MFSIPFQHKYGCIRDERSGVESYPYPIFSCSSCMSRIMPTAHTKYIHSLMHGCHFVELSEQMLPCISDILSKSVTAHNMNARHGTDYNPAQIAQQWTLFTANFLCSDLS